ncbi:LOW QUALITY PROTEIN: surfeit locus protein 6 homolog [Galleria mellonella]|uniref:LOW QUALITY PROTEIN: surfeit locus protein 6 homolog n=1 Tax=Galleria mellonella TaxID=7137 RepID=A0A6J1X4T7_GALME|nr:LOW QUALITY PROTEIN: surfeit locus protein 6 homolog [Galleria mellonella]
MSIQKKKIKSKKLRTALAKELSFVKNVFSMLSIPLQIKNEDEDMDFEIEHKSAENKEINDLSKRARSIAELEEKLEKIKSQNKFTLKNKLAKKSLNSKLNKKMKKKERLNKKGMKMTKNLTQIEQKTVEKSESKEVNKFNIAKPVFNNDGKLVFSKFDFANVGQRDKGMKAEKDPQKILNNLKQQEEKIRRLEETENDKAREFKEKVAWKNVLEKAEGQKVKDDPSLLKKSIKRMEQKKKHSKKQWENRIKNVEQKKEERQKKRKENIGKKKKEKKAKVLKAAVKRGRVVI